MSNKQNTLHLVIAGAGAGKTHNMVQKIVEVLPSLKSNSFLAAITFTNAATDVIKSRLLEVIQIPPNVFVGTNYSFFNRFILIPYATIFGFTALDKYFLEIDINANLDKLLNKEQKKNFAIKNKTRSRLIDSWLKKGKIPFEQIADISAKLICEKRIREIVCARLQYLFIDEFQDLNQTQYIIFDQIKKGKQTTIYAVGDPEQYISSFTYRNKKSPTFENIPFNKFKKYAQIESVAENRRSYSEIVDFLNHFHTELEQESTKGSSKSAGVYFIENTDLGPIIDCYRTLIKTVKPTEEKPVYFYLSFENKTFESYAGKYGLIPVSNDQVKSRSILEEALHMISTITGLSRNQFLEKYNSDILSYRGLGIKLIKAIKEKLIINTDHLFSFIENDLGLNINDTYISNCENQFFRVKNLLQTNNLASNIHQFTSIHKSKGLEADNVLVVARTKKSLNKWLTTDKEERFRDKSDQCRIGFVAFSRAKQVLCIACLQEIDDQTKKRLLHLGVKFMADGTSKESTVVDAQIRACY